MLLIVCIHQLNALHLLNNQIKPLKEQKKKKVFCLRNVQIITCKFSLIRNRRMSTPSSSGNRIFNRVIFFSVSDGSSGRRAFDSSCCC